MNSGILVFALFHLMTIFSVIGISIITLQTENSHAAPCFIVKTIFQCVYMSLLVALEVVFMTTADTTGDYRIAIMTTLGL